MKSLGCTNAVNLDGGGSSDMYLNGKIISGNFQAERPIGTALIVR